MPVVSNSTPLIHLAKIDRLDLLKEFFGEISELVEKADWIKVVRIKDETLKKSLMLELDEGESEAIVLALEINSELLLIDDYDGREIARALGLKVTGTVGVLLKAKFQGKITNLKEELEKLKKTGFWLSDELYKRILEEVGEG